MRKLNQAAILIFSLTSALASAELDPTASLAKIDNFVYDSTSFINEKSLSQIKAIDKVVGISTSPFQEDGKPWLEVTIKFSGLTIWFVHEKGKDTGLLTKVSIQSPKYKMPCGIHIGSTRSSVVKCLGTPNKSTTEADEYSGETENFEMHYSASGALQNAVFFIYTG